MIEASDNDDKWLQLQVVINNGFIFLNIARPVRSKSERDQDGIFKDLHSHIINRS